MLPRKILVPIHNYTDKYNEVLFFFCQLLRVSKYYILQTTTKNFHSILQSLIFFNFWFFIIVCEKRVGGGGGLHSIRREENSLQKLHRDNFLIYIVDYSKIIVNDAIKQANKWSKRTYVWCGSVK